MTPHAAACTTKVFHVRAGAVRALSAASSIQRCSVFNKEFLHGCLILLYLERAYKGCKRSDLLFVVNREVDYFCGQPLLLRGAKSASGSPEVTRTLLERANKFFVLSDSYR